MLPELFIDELGNDFTQENVDKTLVKVHQTLIDTYTSSPGTYRQMLIELPALWDACHEFYSV